jgi:hypothetical protein
LFHRLRTRAKNGHLNIDDALGSIERGTGALRELTEDRLSTGP